MRITNIQKKELSDIFKKNNLNLIDFETSGEYQEFKVKFKYDYFSFSIEKTKDDTYLLSIFSIDRKNAYNLNDTWINTQKRFDNWAKQVSTELTSTTGWETFENTNFLNTEYEDLNDEFTETEKIQAKESIKELKVKIKLLNLSQEKLEIIENKLDILSLKVDELNKFDWKSLFIGTIASLIMTFIIPQEASGMFWEYIKSSFNNLKING
ncbi:hypothetical protein [Flavobacterium undicola]|uniref:hypothetical protein n=1 Tax=Flavobacterium undicola TaxID=1932779 RepID=UPI001378758A|nr:hypothetical protein [Flavobacterium undicola]MBA0884098.1 hypothetical protein [Flavobacterium undicola]